MTSRIRIGLGLAALLATSCRSTNQTGAAQPENNAAVASVPSTTNSNRKIYPWSVVPGGVDSPQAVRDAIKEDPVVAEHYKGLDPEGLRPQVLTGTVEGHVSFRVGDKVYWTGRKVTLRNGELVLTGGDTMLRARCGNRVSALPQQPVAPPGVEPPESLMDEPTTLALLEIPLPQAPYHLPISTEPGANPKTAPAPAEREDFLPLLNPIQIAWTPSRWAEPVIPGTATVPAPGTPTPSNPASPATPDPEIPAFSRNPQLPVPLVLTPLVTPEIPLIDPVTVTAPAEFAAVHLLPPVVPWNHPAVTNPATNTFPSPSSPWTPSGQPPTGDPPSDNPPPGQPPSLEAPPIPPPDEEEEPVGVPEPAAWTLVLLGAAGSSILLGRGRRS